MVKSLELIGSGPVVLLRRQKVGIKYNKPLRDVRRRNAGELTSLGQNELAETHPPSATAVGQAAISLCLLHNRRLNAAGDKPPMLKKIISIKNVGRFRNSAAPGNRELARAHLHCRCKRLR